MVFAYDPWGSADGPGFLTALAGVLLVPVVLHATWRLVRQHHRERGKASDTAQLVATVLSTTRDWLWAVGADGRFTFSTPASRDLLGYEPSELLGRPWSLVIDPDDLATARQTRPEPDEPEAAWTGLVAICRHRDGTRVPVEVSGRARLDRAGRSSGYEGMSRPLERRTARGHAAEEVRARVEAVLTDRTLLTAFQPIRCLGTGAVIGAEALTR